MVALMVASVGGAATGRAGSASADPLARIAETNGTVRVIVGLPVAFQPGEALRAGARASQRDAIRVATGNVEAALAGTSFRVVHRYWSVPYVALELSREALTRVRSSGLISSLDEDVARRPLLAQSTRLVEAPESWELGRTGAGRVVAILDTGVDKGHPFLQQPNGKSKVVSEACYSANNTCKGNVNHSTAAGSGVPCTFADRCDHGTHLAGMAAGRGKSFSGVARDARLISIRVFSRFTGAGNCAAAGEDPCALSFASDQLKGLERVFALRNKFSIDAAVLAAGGGNFTSACDSDPLKPAIDNLRAAKIATVIASGNDGFSNAVNAPACISTAVTVGSTNKSDIVSTFSNSGVLVDFFAPGESIKSSEPGGGFETSSGTSNAAAHVAGAFAILGQTRPESTLAERQDSLLATGKEVTDTLATPQITRDRIRVLSAGANLRHTGLDKGPSFALAGGNLASAGVGLARRTNGNQNPVSPAPSRTIVLNGIPANAVVTSAYLVWQTVGGPDRTAIFKGSSRTGRLVGASGQFSCWNTNDGGAIRTYRYNVPVSQIPGNGSYSIGGVGATNGADGQGASLLVVYKVPGASRTGRVYLKFGSMTARPGAPAMRHTFTGLTVPNGLVAPALHLGIGDGEAFPDPAMTFAGAAVTGTNLWSGADGLYWDDARVQLPPALLPAGAKKRANSQAATGECLTWAYAALTYRK
jgi:subtilisin family serine protease